MESENLNYLTNIMPVSFFEGGIKDSYEHDIKLWRKIYEKYRTNLKLKALKDDDQKAIQEKMLHRYDEDGAIIIESRNKIYDLSNYYNNPDSYYFDLIQLIRELNILTTDPDSVCSSVTFIYTNHEKCRISSIHYMFNMIMWYPFFNLGINITPDKLFMTKTFVNDEYVGYINNKIIEPYKHLVTYREMSLMLARMYDLYMRVCENNHLDISFSLYDIIMRWEHNQELFKINHTKIPDNMSIAESENMMKERSKRFNEIMTNEEEDTQIKYMLLSGKLNTKQVREFAINIGHKPDLDGRTLNTNPQSNLLTYGLRDPIDYITDATGGRKAAALALEIDQSGYFQRTLCKETADIRMCEDPNYDCHSKHYYTTTITDKKCLRSFNGRYYLNNKNHLVQLRADDYDMIGKTLSFRSPATCASKKGICWICYGSMASQNYTLNIGINSALKCTERFYQNTMSAKHMLDTNTTTLNLTEYDKFADYFCIEDGYRIHLKDDIDYIEIMSLRINVNEIYKDDRNKEAMVRNEYVTGFSIYDSDEDKAYEFNDQADNFMYFSNDLLDMISEKRDKGNVDSEGWINIPFTDLIDDSNEENPTFDLFHVQLKNKEISKPLSELKSLIEKGDEIKGCESISELISHINELMHEGGIFTDSLHTEILVRNLIRDRNDPSKIPDYSQDQINPLFRSIHNSILNGNSVIQGLTFERVHQQLKSPLTYRKTGTSPYDPLFISE